jgi:transcriptional regulator with XRE-family HTH domain
MHETTLLLASLKQALKARGLAYRDVARELGLSEASVKRMFSRAEMPLTRLEKICALAGLSLADLMRRMEAEHRRLEQLTHAQEEKLVADPERLFVAYLAVNGYSFQEILADYRFEPPALIGHLIALGRVGLIELLPGNRIQLRISPQFAWLPDGPIQRFFMRDVGPDFLDGAFAHVGAAFYFYSAPLSPRAAALMQGKLEALAKDFNELAHADRQQPLETRANHGLLLAFRPWRAKLFQPLERGSAPPKA